MQDQARQSAVSCDLVVVLSARLRTTKEYLNACFTRLITNETLRLLCEAFLTQPRLLRVGAFWHTCRMKTTTARTVAKEKRATTLAHTAVKVVTALNFLHDWSCSSVPHVGTSLIVLTFVLSVNMWSWCCKDGRCCCLRFLLRGLLRLAGDLHRPRLACPCQTTTQRRRTIRS